MKMIFCTQIQKLQYTQITKCKLKIKVIYVYMKIYGFCLELKVHFALFSCSDNNELERNQVVCYNLFIKRYFLHSVKYNLSGANSDLNETDEKNRYQLVFYFMSLHWTTNAIDHSVITLKL